MPTNFFKFFTEHPNSVCMSYIQHFKFSFGLSVYFLKKSFQSLLHAICPACYITSSSDVPKELSYKFEQVGCRKKN